MQFDQTFIKCFSLFYTSFATFYFCIFWPPIVQHTVRFVASRDFFFVDRAQWRFNWFCRCLWNKFSIFIKFHMKCELRNEKWTSVTDLKLFFSFLFILLTFVFSLLFYPFSQFHHFSTCFYVVHSVQWKESIVLQKSLLYTQKVRIIDDTHQF